MSATYLGELHTWPPVTRHYRLDDGRHVAITVLDFLTAEGTVVFLCDENGIQLDADLTTPDVLDPLYVLPAGTTYEQALDHITTEIGEH